MGSAGGRLCVCVCGREGVAWPAPPARRYGARRLLLTPPPAPTPTHHHTPPPTHTNLQRRGRCPGGRRLAVGLHRRGDTVAVCRRGALAGRAVRAAWAPPHMRVRCEDYPTPTHSPTHPPMHSHPTPTHSPTYPPMHSPPHTHTPTHPMQLSCVYRDNPYHSFRHCVDVAHTTFMFIWWVGGVGVPWGGCCLRGPAALACHPSPPSATHPRSLPSPHAPTPATVQPHRGVHPAGGARKVCANGGCSGARPGPPGWVPGCSACLLGGGGGRSTMGACWGMCCVRCARGSCARTHARSHARTHACQG